MKVTVPYSPVWEPLDWAKEHCPSYITNTAVPNDKDYDVAYYFSDERDALMFALRWSGQWQ